MLLVLAAATVSTALLGPPPLAPVAAPAVRAPIAVTARPAPPTLSSTLGAAGFSTPLRPLQGFTPLQGLAPSGDAAPQCRATCTKQLAICGGDAECSEPWRQCLTACSNAAR